MHFKRLARATRGATALAMTIALAALGATGAYAQQTQSAPLGRTIATQGTANGVPACISCHGANGEGNAAAGFPRLAGLGAGYFEAQLAAFADGSRENSVMQPLAKNMSANERNAVAQYFSNLSAPQGIRTQDPADAAPSDSGAWLATRGRWQQDLPACVQCHGPGGAGVGTAFPPLAGQPAAYIEAQLNAWKNGKRPPGPLALMPAVASKLSDADIHAVALYYAQQPQSEATGAVAASQPQTDTGAHAASFQPPPESAMPDGDFGKSVKLGEQIFRHTGQYAGKFVGNSLSCANCHIDAGRKADSGPLWAAFVSYPAYRSKNGHVNTFAERLQGCFNYSMNGKAPPLGDPVLVALESYSYWLATGAPVGGKVPGRGYPKLPVPVPAQKADYARGAAVYAQHCALCHGAEGQGKNSNGQTVFPPLWGARSFNWGAGMHEIQNAAGFIKANMPLGLGGTLTDQEAWDVATFMDSHERPQDPRFTGSAAQTRAKYHDTPHSLYGTVVNGHLLGSP
ncbi:c-type cytochrome [Paraburkholderia silviterrae]|uniref:C-type cytochrome n=1 Tax=Paraburkholderia silviterrae TaxID=2528715 RepID=A0A4R5MAK4_9BURK|nr:c-type cytochrome [Paraburkholderia silviterrae]